MTGCSSPRATARRTAVLAVIAVLLSLAVVPARAGHQYLWWNEDGSSFTRFGGGASITIYQGAIEFACDGFTPAADIYVVPAGGLADGAALEDVGGAPNTVFGASGGLFIDETIGRAGGAGFGTGRYAVVYDECQDGVFQQDQDFLQDPAFSIEITTDVPPAGPALAAAKARAATQAERHLLVKRGLEWYEQLQELQAAIECVRGLGACAVSSAIDALREKLIEEGKRALGLGMDAKEAAKKLLSDLVSHYLGIAADPPDPDFRRLSPPLPAPRLDPASSDPVVQATAALGEAAGVDGALAESFLRSVERYQGADAASDGEWALVHARAAQVTARRLADRAAPTAAALEGFRRALVADARDLDALATRLEPDRARVEADGFSASEVRELQRRGLDGAGIAALRTTLSGWDHAATTRSGLVEAVDEALRETRAAADDYRTSADAFTAIIDHLRAQPSRPDTHPLARPGGPYAVDEGEQLLLDGSASTDPDGTVASFAWDVDGDGAYDDATGARPSVPVGAARTGLVGLRVTDDSGRQSLAHALLSVRDVQSAPRIDGLTPSGGDTLVELGDDLVARVTATDPDGDPLTYRWSLDGQAAGGSSALRWTPTVADLGAHAVLVEVSDGTAVGGSTVAALGVTVVHPDADGDGHDATTDCDDGDPAVHPGRPEVVGNGVDDDCDPATPDAGSPPVAAFAHAPGTGRVGQPVQFTDTSADADGAVVGWAWSFGDGATSTERHPAHTYRASGTYRVTLTVTDEQGDTDEVTREVDTTDVPLASFTVDPATPDAGTPARLADTSTDPDGTVVGWQWDFGDGGTSTERQPQHAWAQPGTYEVRLTVTDDRGVSATASRAVRVLGPPTALFVPRSSGRNVALLEGGATVHSRSSQFDAGHSPAAMLDAPEGLPWATRNGSTTDQWVKIELAPGGPWQIDRVQVQPRISVRDQRVRDFEVAVSSTTADDSAFTTVLRATAADNGAVQEFLLARPVLARYVMYRPLNNRGSTCCISTQRFRVPTGQHGGASVAFDDLSSDADGRVVRHRWDFGDGSAGSDLASPTHVFPGPGSYPVTLTVTDDDGRTSTARLVQRVSAPPAPAFTSSPAAPVEGGSTTFTDVSVHPEGAATVARSWDWGDGTAASSAAAPTHAFRDDGRYAVTLTVTDAFGQTAAATREVVVQNVPPALQAGSDWVFYEDTRLTFDVTVSDPGQDTVGCRWEHGDGTGRDGCRFEHAYDRTGTWTATITARDEDGAETSEDVVVTVRSRPVPDTTPPGGSTGAPVPGTDVTYTRDEDFDRATRLNVNHDAPGRDQLQLNRTARPFPFVHVAASGRGTLVRIDVQTGQAVGEYRTAPSGRSRDPSRTTVDQLGNVWVTNRGENSVSGGRTRGSVARVGLVLGGTRSDARGRPDPAGEYVAPPFAYSTCQDRDRDGLLRTSRGRGHVLAWPNTGGVDDHGGVSTAQDECLITYTRVRATGARTVAVDANNDVWVGGSDTSDHEQLSGVTGQPVPGTAFNLRCGGYGGFVDARGVLWSARSGFGLLRYDTTTRTGRCHGNANGNYGLGVDPVTGEVWHTELSGGHVVKMRPDGTRIDRYPHGAVNAQGVAVDAAGNVWVAHALFGARTVGHLRTDGTSVGNVELPGGAGPTGVAVDASGKVWVANYLTDNAQRIDPDIGRVGGSGRPVGHVDLTVDLGPGADPYNYSDMTGIVAIGATSPQGFWAVTQDSGTDGTRWGTVDWNQEAAGSVPPGASITVQARASDSETGLASREFVEITSGAAFDLTGRFLEVRATLKAAPDGSSPVLSDVRLRSAAAVNAPPVAADAHVTTQEDVPVDLVLVADDPDGDPLTYSVGTPTSGTLTGSAPDLRYTPAPGFSGTDSFTFSAHDGAASSGTATVSLTVTPVDDPPTVALSDPGPVDEGGEVAHLTATASDPDSADLSHTWSATGGTVIASGPHAEVTSDDGPGTVSVTVTVRDATSAATATRDVPVRNVAPGAEAGSDQTRYWGLPVLLEGTVSDPSTADTQAGLQPTWEPGDGSPALPGSTVEHTYALPGDYAATLRTRDKDGGTGSDQAAVEVLRRTTALTATGDPAAPFGFARLSAVLADAVHPASGDVAGRQVVFESGPERFVAVTDAAGRAEVREPVLLPPGTHEVQVSFAGDERYAPSTAVHQLAVGQSVGHVTGGGVLVDDPASTTRARGGFVARSDGTTSSGELQHRATGLSYHAKTISALGIAPDGRSAWFAGSDTAGRPFVAHVVDGGTPGAGVDVLDLEVGGREWTRDGTLRGGNITVHRR